MNKNLAQLNKIEILRKLNVGKPERKYGANFPKIRFAYLEGFRFARNNLQKQKVKLLSILTQE